MGQEQTPEMHSDRTKLVWTAVGVTLLVIAVLIYPELLWEVSRERPTEAAGAIPPTFSGNRAAYGWALFSMVTMTMLSIRKMIGIAVEFRTTPWRAVPDIAHYRVAVFAFCAMVVFGVLPDVIILMLWGEAEASTLHTWGTLDRVGDGMAGVGYLIAITMIVRAEQFQRMPTPGLFENHATSSFFEISSRGERMREHIRMVAIVAVIALGLALLK